LAEANKKNQKLELKSDNQFETESRKTEGKSQYQESNNNLVELTVTNSPSNLLKNSNTILSNQPILIKKLAKEDPKLKKQVTYGTEASEKIVNRDNNNLKGHNPVVEGKIEEIKTKTFEKIKTFRESSKGKIKIGFFDILGMRLCHCCCNRFSDMKKIYEKGEEKLNVYLDYLEIVKLLQEFAKMKKTNFDSDQNNIFNMSLKPRFFEKPRLKSLKTTTQLKEKDKDDKTNNQIDYDEVYESYGKIKEHENDNHINKRLIKMFDDDLKLPFDLLRKTENDLLNESKLD